MNASLVFDGSGQPVIPASMGKPSPDQLTGTPFENLGELASRICYDSLGNGRSSRKLHEHILEVRNHSVYEHCNLNVRFFEAYKSLPLFYRAFANRKGVWIEDCSDVFTATVNFRAILEWVQHTRGANLGLFTVRIGEVLHRLASAQAPMILSAREISVAAQDMLATTFLVDDKLSDDQAWVTLWLYGSRGFTHEQVRHRFAMSQRSTRYVDEGDSPYVEHPMVSAYLSDPSSDDGYSHDDLSKSIKAAMNASRSAYRMVNHTLEKWMTSKGAGKLGARKQAWGAARGYLGNALASEMLFSAPVSGWKWILQQRASISADAEIRAVYEHALAALKSSRYGDRFSDFNLIPSPDGIGKVLA